MKALLAAAMAVVLLTAPAFAQDLSAGGRGKGKGAHQTDTRKKGDDKGYNAALAKMPDQTQKVDPWRGVRPEGTNQTGR